MKFTPISVSLPLSCTILMAALVSLCLFHLASPLQAGEPNSVPPGRSSFSPQKYLADRRMKTGQAAVATIPELYDELDFQRAVQVYVWVTPFVVLSEMLDSLERNFGATLTRQQIFEQSVTPYYTLFTVNDTTIYTIGDIDLKKYGPVGALVRQDLEVLRF